MEDFRRQFTLETIEMLESLKRNLQGEEAVSGLRKREIFRALHTVKGTAQTFGFDEASSLAHELETLLSAAENSKVLLIEGFGLLIESLTETSFNIPKNFTEKLRAASPNITETPDFSTDYSSRIPKEVLSQLSNQEKNTLQTAIRAGQHLACLEINFELTRFADELINFRARLNKSGEIIATFPSAKFSDNGKIGFQFLLASPSEIGEIFRDTEADILWDIAPTSYPNDVRGVLLQAARHGREVAAKLGKHVKIKTRTEEITLTATTLKLVFEVLTHLVRNAVDHAIGSKGAVDINLKIVENGIVLLVADDGRGIDLKAVRVAAIEKKFISGDQDLSERETVELIFLSEFSTKSDVTEISGRGIGLDAVKHAIEKHGGKISLATEKEKGTTFEIFLPQPDK